MGDVSHVCCLGFLELAIEIHTEKNWFIKVFIKNQLDFFLNQISFEGFLGQFMEKSNWLKKLIWFLRFAFENKIWFFGRSQKFASNHNALCYVSAYCYLTGVVLVVSAWRLLTNKPFYRIRSYDCWAMHVVSVDASLILISVQGVRLPHVAAKGLLHLHHKRQTYFLETLQSW